MQHSLVIEEFTREEWAQRLDKHLPSSSSSRSSQSRASSSLVHKRDHLKPRNAPHSTREGKCSPQSIQDASVLATSTAYQDDLLTPLDSSATIARKSLFPSVNSQQWPGHAMDVIVPRKFSSEIQQTASILALEGLQITEITQQIIFLWGLLPSPMAVLRKNAQLSEARSAVASESLVDISSLGQKDVTGTRMDLTAESTANPPISLVTTPLSKLGCTTSSTINSASQDHCSNTIEMYSANLRPGKRVYNFKRTQDSEEVDSEAPTSTLPARASRLQRRDPIIDIVSSFSDQLELLRRLIMEEKDATTSTYLSHFLVLVGSSIGTSKACLCFTRSAIQYDLHDSQEFRPTEMEVDLSQTSSTQPLPTKTKEQDTHIRSTLRQLLQSSVLNSITGNGRPKGQAKVHLVVAFSSTSGTTQQSPLNLPPSSSKLTHVRIPHIILSKWNPKKPVAVLRLEPEISNASTLVDAPLQQFVATARLGPPIPFGVLQ